MPGLVDRKCHGVLCPYEGRYKELDYPVEYPAKNKDSFEKKVLLYFNKPAQVPVDDEYTFERAVADVGQAVKGEYTLDEPEPGFTIECVYCSMMFKFGPKDGECIRMSYDDKDREWTPLDLLINQEDLKQRVIKARERALKEEADLEAAREAARSGGA